MTREEAEGGDCRLVGGRERLDIREINLPQC